MVPRTFPSSLHPFTVQRQLVALFLDDVTGLQRWVDYIPVNFGKGTTLVEGSYNNNGFIAIQEISSGIGRQAFLDYIPVFFDAGSTDTWNVSAVGFIPYGVSGVTSPPSLEISFTRSQTLDPRITFTRASTATRFNASGVLVSEAINGPRFDYDPVTLQPKGLLIEEQRTNLLTYSEQFDNASWTKTRSSITTNVVAAPDSLVTADKLVEDTATGSHTVRNATSVTITSGTTLTASVFAKAAEGGYVIVGIGDGGGTNISRTTFNLSTGAIVSSTTAAANVSAPIPVITSVGNGWYRCAITATVTGVTTAQEWVYKGSDATGAASYTGNGTSGIYIWGAQLETGAFPTSYIPTTTAAATRAADVAVMTGTNFSDWYNASGGALFAEFAWEGLRSVAGQRILIVDDGTTTNYWGMVGTGSNNMQNPVVVSGVTEATNATPATTYVVNTSYKQAIALALNNSVAAISGVAGTTDTVVAVPSGISALRFAGSSGGTTSNIWFCRIAYYPLRLTNTELRALTS